MKAPLAIIALALSACAARPSSEHRVIIPIWELER